MGIGRAGLNRFGGAPFAVNNLGQVNGPYRKHSLSQGDGVPGNASTSRSNPQALINYLRAASVAPKQLGQG